MAPGAPAGPAAAPGAPAAPAAPPADLPKDKPAKEVSVPTPANIVVSLPADAKLLVDDALTTSTSSLRRLTSPELAPGKEYHYTLKAQIVRDGQTLTAVERITVRAGEETEVSLPVARFAGASVAAK
jgi:uncharacterized protein (TIGR03000 family)